MGVRLGPRRGGVADQQPFKLLDFVGLDTTSYISQGWAEKAERGEISKELVQPIPLLEDMVKQGKLGRKSGHGFYEVGRLCGENGLTDGAVRQVILRRSSHSESRHKEVHAGWVCMVQHGPSPPVYTVYVCDMYTGPNVSTRANETGPNQMKC